MRMVELVIEQPGEPSRTIPLMGADMQFGRAADNDVVLVAEEVSRHHARICRRGDAVVVIDLKSLNGVFVNGQRVAERVLTDGDEVWFGGKCRVIFRDERVRGHARPRKHERPSTLQDNLDQIRAKMDEVGSHLTMMGTQLVDGQTPAGWKASPQELMDISRAFRRLEALYRVSQLFASEFDLRKRLSAVLDTVMEVLGAERGFVMVRDETTGALEVIVARGMGKALESEAPSMGIARSSAETGEPVLMMDADSDEAFGARESVIVQNIVSAMSVPLKIEGRVLGATYVDSRRPGFAFDDADLELFASLALQSAMAVENVQLHQRMVAAERKRANLGRFLSPAIVDEIMKRDSTLELGGWKRVVTTLFCDIRGFTPMTERMAPADIVQLLNEHFTAMTEIVFEHKGTLDKYIGDEIMAVFGAPLSAVDDAERAVRAALAIQARNTALNEKRRSKGQPEIALGIGMDTGEVIAGYVGSPQRMEFTVVGDHVNTAHRLCDLAAPGQILIGKPTYEGIQDAVRANSIGPVMLEGKQNAVEAFEIFPLETA